MSTIRAIVVDPAVEGLLKIGEVESPRPASSEALIRVSAISLNLGEVRTTTKAKAGWRPGWDLSGVVEQPAVDGSGPPVGTRVFGLVHSGSWAELIAVPTAFLAVIPEEVTFAQAATLPVAGLTALYALERGSFLLNRNVLVTGASGGVGHFACQLAQQAGAKVIALVRREECAASLREIGVHNVVVGENVTQARSFGPYDLVVGAATDPEMTLQARLESVPSGVHVIDGIGSRLGVSKDLGRLARMVAEQRLHPQVALETSWTEIAEATKNLLNRRIAGKAVLYVS